MIAWDADAETDARDFLINQATPQGIGETLADRAAALLGNKGDFAIVTASLSAANQNEWMRYIRARLAGEVPGGEDRGGAAERRRSRSRLQRDADDSQGAPRREADHGDRCAGRSGRRRSRAPVRAHRREGHRPVAAEHVQALREGGRHRQHRALEHARSRATSPCSPPTRSRRARSHPAAQALEAGRLGRIEVRGDQVLLGKPFVFTKENIDGFDF